MSMAKYAARRRANEVLRALVMTKQADGDGNLISKAWGKYRRGDTAGRGLKGITEGVADFAFGRPGKGGQRGALGAVGHGGAKYAPYLGGAYLAHRLLRPATDPFLAQKAQNYQMRYQNQQYMNQMSGQQGGQ